MKATGTAARSGHADLHDHCLGREFAVAKSALGSQSTRSGSAHAATCRRRWVMLAILWLAEGRRAL